MSDKKSEKKQSEKDETAENKAKKTPEVITTENTKAAKKLTEAAKKPEKKHERYWGASIGTTKAETSDHTMSTSTTGLKFQNKTGTTEFTLGATTISEQQ